MPSSVSRKADLNSEAAMANVSSQASTAQAFAKIHSTAVSDQITEGALKTLNTLFRRDTRQERAAKWTERVERLRSKLYRTKDLLEESKERLDLLQQHCDDCGQVGYYEQVGRTGPTSMESGERKKEEEGG
jgi:aminoglycoside phosphotransferase (APT) family kinase protein